MKSRNDKEPPKQHNEGDEPWQKVVLNVFEIEDKHFLITVVHYSSFIEIEPVTTGTSTCLIQQLKNSLPDMAYQEQSNQTEAPKFLVKKLMSLLRTREFPTSHVRQCTKELSRYEIPSNKD